MSLTMRLRNFCATCGARLTERHWRSLIRGAACPDCWKRSGRAARARSIIIVALMCGAAFGFGRYLRATPPPLTIQRAANSPLPDLPINLSAITRRNEADANRNPARNDAPIDETVYICGARTQKGTPCKRRVHLAGERCYQHKGMPAMVPLEKLTIKP